MAFSVNIVRRAAGQIEKAAAWWAENRTAAPDAIREELQIAFDLIARHPDIGAKASNTRLLGVRRIHLSRIRYYLYYRVRFEADTIEVLAFWHTSRGAGPDL
jgi:plasmid stabilization system protein ParE